MTTRAAMPNRPSSPNEIPRRPRWFNRAMVAAPRRHVVRTNPFQHHGWPYSPVHLDHRGAFARAPARLLPLDPPRPTTHPESLAVDPRGRPREFRRGHERNRDVILAAGERPRN